MTDPIHPVGPVERREGERRERDRRAERRALVSATTPTEAEAEAFRPAQPEASSPPPPSSDRDGAATLAAHIMGQKGGRKGLRGGRAVLEAARAAYLGAQFAGAADRRPRTGVKGKTEV